MTFRMRSDADAMNAQHEAAEQAREDAIQAGRKRQRRGVKSLGFKKEPKQKYWRGKPVNN